MVFVKCNLIIAPWYNKITIVKNSINVLVNLYQTINICKFLTISFKLLEYLLPFAPDNTIVSGLIANGLAKLVMVTLYQVLILALFLIMQVNNQASKQLSKHLVTHLLKLGAKLLI